MRVRVRVRLGLGLGLGLEKRKQAIGVRCGYPRNARALVTWLGEVGVRDEVRVVVGVGLGCCGCGWG